MSPPTQKAPPSQDGEVLPPALRVPRLRGYRTTGAGSRGQQVDGSRGWHREGRGCRTMEGNAKTKLGINTFIPKVVFYRLVGDPFAGPPCALVRGLGSFFKGKIP